MSSEQDPYIRELQESSSSRRWSILALVAFAVFVCVGFMVMLAETDLFGPIELVVFVVGGGLFAHRVRLHYRRGSGTATAEELKELEEIEENERRQREWERKHRW